MEKCVLLMYKVCVMMATYNPKEYLIDQIKSVFDQEGVSVELVISDDCSKDRSFIERYADNDKVHIIKQSKNKGVTRNIMYLMKYAYDNFKDADFYAYCDQDDVWLKDKLITGINKLNKLPKDMPNLYYSNLLVTDSNLTPSHELFKRGIVKNNFGQALSQVFVFACTTIINREMLGEIANFYDYDLEKIGYDTLVYYLAILFGNAVFDDEPHILYRQHMDNVSGVKKNGLDYIIDRCCAPFRKKEIQQTFKINAQFLIDNFGDRMTSDQRRLCEKVADYKGLASRFKLLTNKEIRAGYFPKDFYRAVRIILNKY